MDFSNAFLTVYGMERVLKLGRFGANGEGREFCLFCLVRAVNEY